MTVIYDLPKLKFFVYAMFVCVVVVVGMLVGWCWVLLTPAAYTCYRLSSPSHSTNSLSLSPLSLSLSLLVTGLTSWFEGGSWQTYGKTLAFIGPRQPSLLLSSSSPTTPYTPLSFQDETLHNGVTPLGTLLRVRTTWLTCTASTTIHALLSNFSLKY